MTIDYIEEEITETSKKINTIKKVVSYVVGFPTYLVFDWIREVANIES